MDFEINKKIVLASLKALRALSKTQKEFDILQDDDSRPLFLQVQLKKIPKTKKMQKFKVRLPHRPMSAEVCLIVGDLDKKDHKADCQVDILSYKELLQKQGISSISEVITLRQLRTEYKTYEAKQKLLAAYDTFLADERILECLPRLLGKHFFNKRKFPVAINMKAAKLKDEIDKALKIKVFQITGKGNSCCSEVACLDMTDTQILENISAMTTLLSKRGSSENVMGLYLKLAKSKAVPIYTAYALCESRPAQEIKKQA